MNEPDVINQKDLQKDQFDAKPVGLIAKIDPSKSKEIVLATVGDCAKVFKLP